MAERLEDHVNCGPECFYSPKHLMPIESYGQKRKADFLSDKGLDSNSQPVKRKSDPVDHPEHYTSHPSGIECIEITRHMNFNLGNALKYIWRADLKGKSIEDLKKAVWYLQDEITRRRAEQ